LRRKISVLEREIARLRSQLAQRHAPQARGGRDGGVERMHAGAMTLKAARATIDALRAGEHDISLEDVVARYLPDNWQDGWRVSAGTRGSARIVRLNAKGNEAEVVVSLREAEWDELPASVQQRQVKNFSRKIADNERFEQVRAARRP
jgi:hypothetical protein